MIGLLITNLLSYPISLFLANQTAGEEIYFRKDDHGKRDKYLENENGCLDYLSQGSPGEKNESIFCRLRVIFLCASSASNLVQISTIHRSCVLPMPLYHIRVQTQNEKSVDSKKKNKNGVFLIST